MIVAAVETHPEATAVGVAKAMQRRRVCISADTVRRRLAEAGFKHRMPTSKPALSERQRQNRLEWARNQLGRDWSRVIFTDETTVLMAPRRAKVWRKKGQRVVFRTRKHPGKIHLWGCFARNGFGAAYTFVENLNADVLCTIYEQALRPSIKKLFGAADRNWVLLEDNDPKHTSQKAQKWRKDNSVERIHFPTQSPDLNPIENLWSILKHNIAKHEPKSLKDLQNIMCRQWKALPVRLCAKLADSMPDRIQQVIAANGDYILY